MYCACQEREAEVLMRHERKGTVWYQCRQCADFALSQGGWTVHPGPLRLRWWRWLQRTFMGWRVWANRHEATVVFDLTKRRKIG